MSMKTTRTTVPGDRYRFDFELCRSVDGWAQLDTTQDAAYFGNWVSPSRREIVSFAEGDLTRTECADEESFAAELRRVLDFYTDHDGKEARLDPGGNAELRAEIERLGFGAWLH